MRLRQGDRAFTMKMPDRETAVAPGACRIGKGSPKAPRRLHEGSVVAPLTRQALGLEDVQNSKSARPGSQKQIPLQHSLIIISDSYEYYLQTVKPNAARPTVGRALLFFRSRVSRRTFGGTTRMIWDTDNVATCCC